MSSSFIQSSSFKQNHTNITTVYSSTHSKPEDILTLVEAYSVPIICICGIIGNTISAVVFLQNSLRKNSSSIFLAARSISDNGFLATLLTIWASSVYDLHLGNSPPMCQLLIFFTYVFGCFSIWLVVFVTAENYIRICRPFLVQHMCNTRNAKVSMLILLAVILMTYNFPFWTIGGACIPLRKYYDFIQILVYVDSVLTLIVPAVIMAILTSAIAATTIASCKRRRRRSTASMTNVKTPLMKVTTMLLVVTLSFFLLNVPHHVVRLRLMILAFVEKKVNSTLSIEIAMQSISQLLYYLSMSTNVFIYAGFSGNFRKSLCDIFKRKTRNISVSSNARVAIYRTRKVNVSMEVILCKEKDISYPEEAFPLRRFQSSVL